MTNNSTDTPRTDAFGNNLVKCYCPRCIVGVHDDIQLAAQYRKHAEWRERAEKAEAEVERLKKMVMEAAELGDKRSDNFKSRAEKAEASLIKINEELCHAGVREYGN
jgi:hypothetical protein